MQTYQNTTLHIYDYTLIKTKILRSLNINTFSEYT